MSRMAELWDEFHNSDSIEDVDFSINDEIAFLLSQKNNPSINHIYNKYLERLIKLESCKCEPIMIDIRELTEKQKCRILGIACEYGICSECEEYHNKDMFGIAKRRER